MKLDELLEARRPLRDVDPAKLAEELEARCSTFVGAYRQTYPLVIYRGVSGPTMDAEIGTIGQWITIRKNRRPVHMNPEKHKRLDRLFSELGIKATRSNSIFCTTSKTIADDWGKTHIIFVRDGWTGTVFETRKKGYAFQALSGAATAFEDDEYAKDAILNMKPKSFSTEAELIEVIKARYEDILITGNSYVALPTQTRVTAEVLDLLKIST